MPWAWVSPSVSMVRQNGQPTAMVPLLGLAEQTRLPQVLAEKVSIMTWLAPSVE
jgi:hypothetical protein